MHDDILEWQVGEVTITSVPESSDPTSPKFMFSTIDKEGVLELKDRAPWLTPVSYTHLTLPTIYSV